jgi:predicted anti-sigma-YlaC factor YlaD
MECDEIREGLSARLDGEDPAPGTTTHEIDRHLAACAACAAWADELGVLHRLVRVREVEPVPDLSAAIVDAFVPQATSRSGWGPLGQRISTVRWALFAVALTQLVLAGPALLLGEDAGATVHVARELGSFDVALAVGLLVAAWQPGRAWGLLPVAAALALVMAGTAVLDMVDGRASTFGEAHHLLDVAGVALLWLVAREVRSPDASAAGRAGPRAA